MTLAEVIYKKSLDLPEEKAQEVIAFIDSLKAQSPDRQGETMSDSEYEEQYRRVRELFADVRIDFGGKPMPDREEANARG